MDNKTLTEKTGRVFAGLRQVAENLTALRADIAATEAKADGNAADIADLRGNVETLAAEAAGQLDQLRDTVDEAIAQMPGYIDGSIAAAADSELYNHLVNEHGLNAPTGANASKLFMNDTRLTRATGIDLGEVTNATSMFEGCTALTRADLALPKATNLNRMFYGSGLRTAHLDCAPTSCANLFYDCYDLEGISGIDFSNATAVIYLMHSSNLRSFSYKGTTSKVTNFTGFLMGAAGYVDQPPLELPDFDFSNATSVRDLFKWRTNIVRYPAVMDFSKATNMDSAFKCNFTLTAEILSRIVWPKKKFNAEKVFEGYAFSTLSDVGTASGAWMALTSIPELPAYVDLSMATNVNRAFAGWTELREATVDITSIVPDKTYPRVYGNPFLSCFQLTHRTYKGLGTEPSLTYLRLMDNINYNNYTSPWGEGSEEARQTIVDSLLTYSFDRRAAGYSDCTLYIEKNVIDRLTAEEKAAITAKGFVLTCYTGTLIENPMRTQYLKDHKQQ